jgi:hypothetical protein|tara:strand:+ start:340 stop:582 length:243 start_codon:yes stop_codon:yes gene_type:complete
MLHGYTLDTVVYLFTVSLKENASHFYHALSLIDLSFCIANFTRKKNVQFSGQELVLPKRILNKEREQFNVILRTAFIGVK